jgi:GT2 family glycosyltransferase
MGMAIKKLANKISVSFIVVGWNNRDILEGCFVSIQNQSYRSFNVIYVDNGSSDGSVAYVKKNYPDVVVIDTGSNSGFAIGNNLGIQKAFENNNCRYVALLNSDARIDHDWLEALVEFADKDSSGASYQTITVDYYEHSIIDSYGIKVDLAGRAIQLGYRQPLIPIHSHQVLGVNAAAALYSRNFLEEQPFGNNYFDCDMWMYLEDVDLAARATIMGWKNWYVDVSCAYHMGSASSSKNPGFSTYMTYRNNGLVLVKNFPLTILLRLIPALVFSDVALLLKLARHRNRTALKAIIKGRLKCLPMLPTFIKKRRIMNRHRNISNKDLLSLMREKL